MNIFIHSAAAHRLKEGSLAQAQDTRTEHYIMCGKPGWVVFFLTLLTTLVLIITVLLGVAAQPSHHFNLAPGLFNRGIANVSDTYHLDMSPVDGTFALWGVIFIWQICWVIYSLTALCRKTGDGRVYDSPILLPSAFYVSFIVSLCLTMGWLFLWDRLFLSLSLVVMLFVSTFLYISLALSYNALERHMPLLYVQERKIDIWCIRILVQNGIALYATWTTIESLLILAVVMTYTSVPVVAEETSSTVSLSILAAFMLVYALTDFFAFDRFSRFTVTPYVVLIVAFSGMFANNADTYKMNSIFIVALLATSAVVALTKIFFICLRQITKQSDSAETTEFLRELDESRHLLK
ncbi:uncharacterized protein LOC124151041 [Haliotis rufescens]|uniref:uncharacterized protein LOC124151041 n=1 Tax=Haliotis rufescens TaxID=6454 RepID=UPI00201E7AB7|nr:uncharacterized protein LOC124151041 [Haliotis rufescens]